MTTGDNPDADPDYVGDFDLVAAPPLDQLIGEGESISHTRVTYESLARRPRSNPRTRTPMRYESPLNPAAFRRDRPSPEPREGLRITVRPLAGAAVGTNLGGRRIREVAVERPVTPLSSKQGPSHRKVRRWNNDNIIALASEIAKASSRGPAVAETLLKAQADAPLYLAVYNPDECSPSTVSRFMQSNDADMKGLRENFFRGEIGCPTSRFPTTKPAAEIALTPEIMLNRLHGRLRKVVIRACTTSQASVKFVDAYERFLVQSFGKGNVTSLEVDVSASLLEPPTVTRKKSGKTVARFCFDAKSTLGGFHRLLLHAVSQFHGLQAASKTVEMEANTARLLTVVGSLSGPKVRLVDHIVDGSPSNNCPRASSRDGVPHATKSLSTLHV